MTDRHQPTNQPTNQTDTQLQFVLSVQRTGIRRIPNSYFDVVIGEHLSEKVKTNKHNYNKVQNKEQEKSARQETQGSVSQAQGRALTLASEWGRLVRGTEMKLDWLEQNN